MPGLILARYGEIGLKGKNRRLFEGKLIERMHAALAGLSVQGIRREYGRIYVHLNGDGEEACRRLTRVFGLVAVSPAVSTDLDLGAIKTAAEASLAEAYAAGARTFKVDTRRPNKAFPLTSPEVNRALGAHLLQRFPDLSVDVHRPAVTLHVELRDRSYLYWRSLPGPGGLPLGVSGRAVLLLSGGIDSPVAGWMIMKRGVEIVAVYFHSFPFTSDRAKEKVIDLCRVLARYSGKVKLYVIPFTAIQKALHQGGPDELETILLRRMMMRIARRVAEREGAAALVTGESVGQVASQTLPSLAATGAVVDLPLLRPLIALDKEEIIARAKAIGTFDISIRPYADCCTVFVPRHPETHPCLERVEAAEAGLVAESLLQEAVEKAEILEVDSTQEGSWET
ncbi:MAG TPA: tRNA 4-thiouridine(8) synthase ThiI [Firmicutes bacterium]|nr:tRNA 4-thiouridine(8) synthase ThiI [Bacillota bacterium]